MNTQLKSNNNIRVKIAAYNSEFSYRLNGIELSFTGSRIKGYKLYFIVCTSRKIVNLITCGNEKDILTAIDAIYQFSATPFSILKPMPSDSNIHQFVY